MKIVFFTDRTSIRGLEILQQMSARSLSLDAIFIDVGNIGRRGEVRKVRNTLRRIGPIETTKFIHKKVRSKLKRRDSTVWQSTDFYRSYSSSVHIVADFNGPECERLLSEIDPDLVVLGSCSRILRQSIIKVPNIGILNAHPGLLPDYRGVDTLRWAVYHGGPVGVTVHFVDEGVDTGSIVAQEQIDLAEGDSIKSLKKKANYIAGKLMAETVLKLVQVGHIPEAPQIRSEGKQYYRMPISLRQTLDTRLSSRSFSQGIV